MNTDSSTMYDHFQFLNLIESLLENDRWCQSNLLGYMAYTTFIDEITGDLLILGCMAGILTINMRYYDSYQFTTPFTPDHIYKIHDTIYKKFGVIAQHQKQNDQ